MKKIITILAILALLLPSASFAAVAYNSSDFYNFTGTSGSQAFTAPTGTNVGLVLCSTNAGGVDGGLVASYNGSSFTEYGSAVQIGVSLVFLHMFVLVIPSSDGASHSLAVSRTISGDTWSVFSAYTGLGATGQPDVSTTKQFAAASGIATTSLTTLADNDLTVLCTMGSRTPVAGTGSNFRINNTSSLAMYDSNTTFTPPQTVNMALTQTPDNAAWATSMLALQPPGAAPSGSTPMFGNIIFFQ